MWDAGAYLLRGVRQAGFDHFGFFGVRDGFALMTRIERIRNDGTPHPSRWSTGPRGLLEADDLTSLSKLLRALRYANNGRFRVILLYVSPHSPAYASVSLPPVDAGGASLTGDFRQMPFSPDVAVRVLVYEFVKTSTGVRLVPSSQSQFSGTDHLRNAGVRL